MSDKLRTVIVVSSIFVVCAFFAALILVVYGVRANFFAGMGAGIGGIFIGIIVGRATQ